MRNYNAEFGSLSQQLDVLCEMTIKYFVGGAFHFVRMAMPKVSLRPSQGHPANNPHVYIRDHSKSVAQCNMASPDMTVPGLP
jgi:hypothetical protein